MAKDCSFDIVSKIELPAVRNAINTTLKEIKTRYDFKGSMSDVKLEEETLVLVSDDNYKLEQLTDVLVMKLIKQNVPTRNLDYGKVENAFSGNVRQRVKLIQGIDNDNAKKINNLIKESKVKVKTQLQDDQLRVTGKNRDDLQQVIALVRGAELPIDVQFTNYR